MVLSVRQMPDVLAEMRAEVVRFVREAINEVADDEPPSVAARLRAAAATICATLETGLTYAPPDEEDR